MEAVASILLPSFYWRKFPVFNVDYENPETTRLMFRDTKTIMPWRYGTQSAAKSIAADR